MKIFAVILCSMLVIASASCALALDLKPFAQSALQFSARYGAGFAKTVLGLGLTAWAGDRVFEGLTVAITSTTIAQDGKLLAKIMTPFLIGGSYLAIKGIIQLKNA